MGWKMPTFYKIDKERRLVMTTASGVTTMDDALAHQKRLLHDPDFAPNFSQLLDFTHVMRLDLSTENVRELAQTNVFSPDSHRAFIVSSEAAYGFARAFENLRERMGEHGIRVFRDLEDALLWVFSEKQSDTYLANSHHAPKPTIPSCGQEANLERGRAVSGSAAATASAARTSAAGPESFAPMS